eukprot:scaffold3378_cov174-Skeletonema_marinoi.AAC.1
MLASNPNPIKRVCQFKYKLDTTSDGEYIVLQAGSWEKGGTSFATVAGGAPFDLFKAGHVVRDGTDARKCNRWPFTPYCNQFSPFVRDASDYNPILSRKGWDKVTCENVVSVVDDVTGIEDEFNPAIPGPVFASNGHLLVEADGTCTNLANNPEDYFKSSPALKGCRKCESGYGFGTPDDTRSKCFPCQSGYISKVVDGKTQCVVDPTCVECDNTQSPYMVENGYTCDKEDRLSFLINRRCNGSGYQSWVTNKYCRLTCYEGGVGYGDGECCPRVSCTKCLNEPNQSMTNNGQTCAGHSNSIERNCYENDNWRVKQFCQQSCFDAGRGYEGVFCCA